MKNACSLTSNRRIVVRLIRARVRYNGCTHQLTGKSETIKLFNGKNLDGWEGRPDLWSVKDGVIVAKNTEPIAVSTYLLTKQKFSDFRLTAAVKLGESEMHSGIAMWGKKFEKDGEKSSYQGHLVMFPFPRKCISRTWS